MEKILVNGSISIFLLMLIIFGNFLGELMPCRVQTHLKNHMLLKHFLGFLTLLFFAAITVFKDNRVDVVFYCILLYVTFILISKTNYRFFIAIAILFGLTYFLEIYASELNAKDSLKELNILETFILQNYELIQKAFIYLTIPLTIFGFMVYLGNKKREYKSNFKFVKFFLGKPSCRNNSPSTNFLEDIEALRYIFN